MKAWGCGTWDRDISRLSSPSTATIPLMTSQQWVHVTIIIIVMGMSAISWAVRRFRDYQAKQQVKAAQQRQREQILRTGRGDANLESPVLLAPPVPARPDVSASPGGSVHDEARRRLQELAQKRRAELEAMARRAAAGQPSQRPPAPRAPQRGSSRPPAPPAPVVRAPKSDPQSRQTQASEDARRRADKQARAAEQRRRTEQDKAAQARDERDAAVRSEPSLLDESASDAAFRQASEAARQPTATSALTRIGLGAATPARNIEQWRRAIVLMEVLGPPPGLRGPQIDPGAPRTF